MAPLSALIQAQRREGRLTGKKSSGFHQSGHNSNWCILPYMGYALPTAIWLCLCSDRAKEIPSLMHLVGRLDQQQVAEAALHGYNFEKPVLSTEAMLSICGKSTVHTRIFKFFMEWISKGSDKTKPSPKKSKGRENELHLLNITYICDFSCQNLYCFN